MKDVTRLFNQALIRFSDLRVAKTATWDPHARRIGRFVWHITVPQYPMRDSDTKIKHVTISGRTLRAALERLIKQASDGTLDT